MTHKIERLRFDDEGQAINAPTMTLAQEIGWRVAQIEWLQSLGPSARTSQCIARHREEIARLKAGEVG